MEKAKAHQNGQAVQEMKYTVQPAVKSGDDKPLTRDFDVNIPPHELYERLYAQDQRIEALEVLHRCSSRRIRMLEIACDVMSALFKKFQNPTT